MIEIRKEPGGLAPAEADVAPQPGEAKDQEGGEEEAACFEGPAPPLSGNQQRGEMAGEEACV